MRPCVVIPTYNNANTLIQVIDDVVTYVKDIIVVNDGSTDNTPLLLSEYTGQINIITFSINKGKGAALQRGLDFARTHGYTHAITIDSDGQHYPSDIPLLLSAAQTHPDAIILGCRGVKHENMASNSTFANRFSNFWFAVQTFKCPGDTQTGFRVYPLLKHRMRFFSNRYEAELAVLVDSCWRGTEIKSVPVNVYYPPATERVSHFRPLKDFTRISILNTCLCFIAVIYGYPRMVLNKITKLFQSK